MNYLYHRSILRSGLTGYWSMAFELPRRVPSLKIAVLHYQPRASRWIRWWATSSTRSRSSATPRSRSACTTAVFDLLKAIEKAGADLVFNVCETFADDYRLEVNVAALMEMARIKCHRSHPAAPPKSCRMPSDASDRHASISVELHPPGV